MWRIWRHLAEPLLTALALTAATQAAWAGLPPAISQALAASGIPDSHIGLVVQDLDADTPLLAHGEGRSFNPASVMKLVTTLAALDTLGPAHSFKTQVYISGALRDGTLHGDLIIKGRGDPALTLERFWLLLREVRAQGIDHIAGDVLIDQSCYDLAPSDPAAFDQSPLRPYNAPPAALLVDFNTLTLRLRPAGEDMRLALDPPGLPIRQDVRLTSGDCGDWREGLDYRLDAGALRVGGVYPASCGPQALRLNLLEPGLGAAAAFASLWSELGGRLEGEVLVTPLPPQARLLLEFESPPLARIAADINEYSNNVMARMLFLDLGALRYGPPASLAKSEAALRAWLGEAGLDSPELVLENGSGLSRIERISARSLARLLRYAASRPAFHEFVASLAVLGREGTLKERLAEHPAAGRAWFKTGTLNGARNLAGYVRHASGRMRLLVLLINHRRAAAAGGVQDALIDWAAGAADAPRGTP